ncbi:hypothetical protein E1286_16065 [Nonomuraea terrae]|uniref:Rpn family recombination-promoting nuclease/putative transposase n=1 Tax=Nonomuraea terrae TaxID=2530383 RepID=A0A4R4YS41_9ACTN|nr:hypothetical protein [Nonomuraea terrae]TDD48071.1 hypothetical protein E1286_16065 [Nonomuraea terrae]
MITSQHEGLNKIVTLDLGHTRDMLVSLFDLPIPQSGEARLASPDLSEVDPGVCRADGAILYGKAEEKFGVIVETQRRPDDDKLYAWLEYIANFRVREKCPACLVVICPNARVARWAEQAIETGHPGLTLTPLVIHEGNTPVITDAAEAVDNIGLAVISTITKSESPQFHAIVDAVERALNAIDRDIAWRYARYINLSLEGDAQREWDRRMAMKTYPYQGEYAEGLLATGRAEGRAEGEAEGEVRGEAKSVLKLLEGRGVPVSEEARERVMGCQDPSVLDAWLLRAIQVESADELFGLRGEQA